MSSTDARLGIWLAVIASAGFSLKAILAKLAYPHGVDPVTLVALRMLLAAPVFVVVAWREARRGAPLSARDWATVSVLGLFGYYGASMLDFYGLLYISAGLERLVLFTYPTLTLLIGWMAHGRRITRREIVASLLCYGGIALAVVHDIEVSGEAAVIALGCALVFGSSLSFAIYLTGAAAPIRKLGATRFSALATLVSTVAVSLHFIAVRPLDALAQPAPVLWLAVAMALFSTVLPVFLQSAAIRRMGAQTAALVGSTGPVITVFLAWWMLVEPVSALQIAGTVLVIAGVLWVGRR
ncbi:MAG: DMT family transporter [Methyloversatilis discipulorum]|uniref:DMT family transporter n=1 Tax=Methyloversatilis discipulorum TaxID=1119528 RepID=UPI0026F22925|nr:DMT family transporter [Methyloversatilis discipulorum]MBV5287646.1 DMT family transporter [Methyloversatilis discipulorum]